MQIGHRLGEELSCRIRAKATNSAFSFGGIADIDDIVAFNNIVLKAHVELLFNGHL